jgi:hypothetical protein
MERKVLSYIEGKVAQVEASEWSDRMSDMAGEAARVAVEPSGSERDAMEPPGVARPTFAEATSWHA